MSSPPGYRLAIRALLFAVLGPFVMAASSPAAVALGWRSMRASAGVGPRAKGRSAAAGAITLGVFGLLFWTWVLWRLWVKLEEQGNDPHRVLPLGLGLFVVWCASGVAGALSSRGKPSTEPDYPCAR